MAPYLKLDPAPADVDLVRGHLENLGKQTGARALSGDADASDFHRLPSQYRLLPGVPGKIGSTEPCCRRRPFKSSHVCEHFFKVTIRDHKNRFASVFTSKVSRDTQGTVRRPGVSEQWDKGRVYQPSGSNGDLDDRAVCMHTTWAPVVTERRT